VLIRLTGLFAIAFCVLALTFAGTAIAQTPTGDAYGGLAGLQQGSSGGGGGGGGETPSRMAALMGAGLLGTGLVLRRTLRSDAHA
jgi:hypothetical protein